MKRTDHAAKRGSRRAGTYLLELTIVMGIAAVLMGLVTVGVHQLLKSHGQLRDATRNGLVQQRLTSLFRKDCREALTATQEENGVRLSMPDERVVAYEVQDNVVFRSWTNTNNEGRDRFYSTRDWACTIELEGTKARLVLEFAPGGSKRTMVGTTRQTVVESEVGRHVVLAASLKAFGNKDVAEDKQ